MHAIADDVLCNILEKHGYTLIESIGKGGEGEVYLCNHNATNAKYAIKVTTTRQEREALMRLWHPNVIYLYDSFIESGRAFLVFEYCEGGNLEKRIQKGDISQNELFSISCHLVLAVQACHSAQIAHLDIKPSNILLTKEGRIKLADFGIAVGTKSHVWGQSRGSPGFVAPEIGTGRPYDPFKADIWSLGVTLHYLATRKLPWSISKAEYRYRGEVGIQVIDPIVPRGIAQLLKMMLRSPPESRIAA
jgi:serine/threonine protein kinase